MICTAHQILLGDIKSRRMKWAVHVACMGERKGAYRVWMGENEKKRPLLDLGVDVWGNIRMDLKEVGWGNID